MNKAVTPKQLELTAGKTRAELLQDTAPHIDFEGPAFKESLKAIDKIEKAEAATAVLAAAGLPCPDFDDFDWKNDPSVILQEQRATAVYHNPYGGLVIRQERLWDEESDPYTVISAENIVTFMEAMAKRAREG
jgi:hypothetical protein